MKKNSTEKIDFSAVKKWIENNIKEVHLYADKRELLVKDIIWGISWIGGIYAINGTSDKRALSSAYLIFSLSLLMEFGTKINKKKFWISRIIDGIFCLAIASITLIAMAFLVDAPLDEEHYKIMFNISAGIMLFMLIDFLIAWIQPNDKQIENIQKDTEKKMDNKISLFEQKLYSGCLGNINKGEDSNE